MIFIGDHFFDIITHFQTIFADNAEFKNSKTARGSSQSILSSYATYRIGIFSQMLSMKIKSNPNLQISQISSLMTPTMYFGMSLGRVGVDFRPLVCSIFEQAIMERVTIMINLAHTAFKDSPQDSSLEPIKSSDLSSPSALLAYPALAQLYNRCMNMLNVIP